MRISIAIFIGLLYDSDLPGSSHIWSDGMNTIEREENCGRGAFDLGMSFYDFVCVIAQTSARASVNSSISRVLVAVVPTLLASSSRRHDWGSLDTSREGVVLSSSVRDFTLLLDHQA